MLSILIPTKDYDCHQLIEELQRQGELLGVPYEIIVGEDGTSAHNLQKNITAEELPCCRRIISRENIGRANIRNRLAIEAKQPNLLFIDSDAIVEKRDFLACYIAALHNHKVVCGGLYHTTKLNDQACSLRFKYERKADTKRDAATRSLRPYDNFTTFNFAISRELFLSIFFKKEIKQYGYEDALFGKELERRGVPVIHIENRLLHNGLENNAIFLEKTMLALGTLASIEQFIGTTPLLSTAAKLRKWHVAGTYLLLWRALRRPITRNLLGKHPSLFLFNIYKLGYYLAIKRGLL